MLVYLTAISECISVDLVWGLPLEPPDHLCCIVICVSLVSFCLFGACFRKPNCTCAPDTSTNNGCLLAKRWLFAIWYGQGIGLTSAAIAFGHPRTDRWTWLENVKWRTQRISWDPPKKRGIFDRVLGNIFPGFDLGSPKPPVLRSHGFLGKSCVFNVKRPCQNEKCQSARSSCRSVSFLLVVPPPLLECTCTCQKDKAYTLWSSNIAMEHGPFEDVFPIKFGDIPLLC